MSTMMATVEKWQDQYFTQIKRVEEPVLRYTEQASETVARYVPARPSFMAEMPTMTEVVESQLKFRKRFVDEQARFVRKMMKAMDPMLTKFETTPQRVAEQPKAPVTKMAPRKTTRRTAA